MKNSNLYISTLIVFFTTISCVVAIGQSAPPITNINGTVCVGDNAQFRVTTSCSIFQWTASNGGVIQGANNLSSVAVVWSSASTNAWIEVTYADCNTSFLALTVYAKTTPTVSLTLSPTTICQPQTITMEAATTNVAGTPYYGWYVDSQLITTTTTSSYAYSAANLAPGSHSSWVTITNMSCSNVSSVTSSSQTFTVSPNVGQVSAPSGITSRCIGSESNTYTASASDATEYAWSITPEAGTISTGGIVTWNSTYSGTAIITVTASGCNGSSTTASTNVTVSPGVGQVSAPTGITSRCIGSGTDTYSATAPNATSYSWVLSPVEAGSISPQGGTVVWSSTFSGLATVSVTANGCTASTTSASTNVNVIPLVGPVSPPSGTLSRCIGEGSDTYTASASNASSYAWSISPTAAGTISSGGTVTWGSTFTGTATVSVTATGCHGSTSTASTNVTTNPLVGQVSTPAGTLTRCPGDGTDTYTASAPYASGYSWSITLSAGTISSSGVVTWNGLYTGTATISVTAHGCNGSTSSASVQVTVESVGTVSIDGISTRCMGEGSDSFYASANNATSYSYILDPPSAGSIVTGAAGYVTWNLDFFGTAIITATATGCNGATQQGTKTVYVTSNVSQVSAPFGELSGCQGLLPTSYTASAVNTTGYNWSISPETAGTIIDGGVASGLSKGTVTWNSSFAGTATITVTALGCSPKNASTDVVILTMPAASISPTGTISSVPTTLSTPFVSGYLYQWYLNGSAMSGKNESTCIVTQPGTYKVTVCNGPCIAMANTPATVLIGDYSGFTDPNFIKERLALVDKRQDGQLLTESDLGTLSIGERKEIVSYFDGFGRVMQHVITQGSPSRLDEVQPIIYDNYGREAVKYLPYASGNDGAFKSTFSPKEQVDYTTSAQYEFYQSTPGVAVDSKPYAETIFERSPLNRPLKHGAAGESWQPVGTDPMSINDYTIKKRHETNGPSEVLLFKYDPVSGLVSLNADPAFKYYGANQLYSSKTLDEHNNEVIEYADKQGRAVCKKVQYKTETNGSKLYTSTYYIYDDLGNLVVVLPPEAVKDLSAQ